MTQMTALPDARPSSQRPSGHLVSSAGFGAHKIALRRANVEVVAHLLAVLKRAQCYKTKKKTGIAHLIWMCNELLEHGIADFPPDKSGRWIGFVQGCMAMRGLLNVDAERDRTRPLYTAAYLSSPNIPVSNADTNKDKL